MENIKSFKQLLASVVIAALFSQTTFAATFTVDNGGLDDVDVTPGNGICATVAGFCTLRAAIAEANALGGTNSINITSTLNFINGSLRRYPTITNAGLRIDGTVDGGSAQKVRIGGGATGTATEAFFKITANSVSFSDFVISNTNYQGINIVDTQGVSITNVMLGIQTSYASPDVTSLDKGVVVSSSSNTILRDLIVASVDKNGVEVANSTSTQILNSKIGTHAGGTDTRGNAFHGIEISGNTAGTNVISGNVVSGNIGSGIMFSSTGTLGGTWWIHGNKIGVDATGNSGPGDSGYIATMGNSSAGVNVASTSNDLNLTIGNNRDGSNDSSEGNTISDNGMPGISVRYADNLVISGNKIGTDADGLDHIPNNGDGIFANAATLDIGTDNDGDATDALEGNVISGNSGWGINVNGADTSTIKIRGNMIGANANGTSNDGDGIFTDDSMTNSSGGIFISASGANTVIIGAPVASGSNATARNIIINNGGGIKFTELGSGPATVKIQNNYIGVDASGSTTAGNTFNPGVGFNDGIDFNLTTGLANLLIGLDTVSTTKSNIIAANQRGIDIGSGANTIDIAGNYIGAILNAASAYIKDGGNLAYGIYLSASNADLSRVTIGSSTSSNFGNVISANDLSALYVGNAGDASTPAQVIIKKNNIGIGQNGTTTLTNSGAGVYLSGNIATITMADNVISNSTGTGVDIRSGTALTFTGNLIGAAGLGTTAAGNGLNGLYISASTLTSVVIGGATAALSNVFAANGGNGIFVANVATDNTPVTISGNYIGVCANPGTGSISTTNLSQCGNSQFGIDILRGLLTIGGDNSLGAAGTGTIAEGNVIAGNILGGILIDSVAPTTGVRVATIVGNLIGVIRTTAAGIFNTANGNRGFFSSIHVNSPTINTLTIGDVGASVASSKRNIISASTGTGGDAIYVVAMSATGTGYIKNNYIGTDWTGAASLPNKTNGIKIESGTFQIGGTGTSTGNVISGNRGTGVFISGSAVDGTSKIQGNKIGLNAAGTADLGNTLNGIEIRKVASSATLQIGGTQTAAKNYISGNGGNGIGDFAINAHTLNVYNNYIGTNAAGTAAIPNDSNGVVISSTAVTANIGDSTGSASARNVISGNGTVANSGAGILAHAANALIIKGNYIGLAADGTTRIPNGAYEIYVDQPNVTTLTIGSGNKINNTDHVGVKSVNVAATNEETMDSDNTWTDMVMNSGSYNFWNRYLADGTTLNNYGPKQCYNGIDDDSDSDIDYGDDPGCYGIRDDSENSDDRGGAFVYGVGRRNSPNAAADKNAEEGGDGEGEDEQRETGGDGGEGESDGEQPVDDSGTQVMPPLTITADEAKAKLRDALDTVVDALDALFGSKIDAATKLQVKSHVVDHLASTASNDKGEAEEEEEYVKTEEKKFIGDTLESKVTSIENVTAGGVTTYEEITDAERFTEILIYRSVDQSLAQLPSKQPKEFSFKSGGIERKIDASTKFVVTFDHQKANKLQAMMDGNNTLVVGPSTIFNGGVSAVLQVMEGAPLYDPLAADKVFFGGLSGLRNPAIEELLPDKPQITNLENMEVGPEFLAWAGSPKNDDELSFFLVDRVDPEDSKTWEITELGEAAVEENHKSIFSVDLEDYDIHPDKRTEFYLAVQNEKGEGSAVPIIVNPELELKATGVKFTNGQEVAILDSDLYEDNLSAFDFFESIKASVLLASAKANGDEDAIRDVEVRKLTGYIPSAPGSIVFVTWKSLVLNSVVVADASQGYFEVEMPEELAQGDHEVIVYAYNKKKNWISGIRTLLFNR